MRAEMERTLEAGQWDAADEKVLDLLRVVSADDEIRGWQRRVADGREAGWRRERRISELRTAILSALQAGQWASAEQNITDLLSLVPGDSQAMQWRSQAIEERLKELAASRQPNSSSEAPNPPDHPPKAKGERNYFDVRLSKAEKPQRFADITLRLVDADLKHNKYTVIIMADDKFYEKKDNAANQAVQFYTSKGGKTPYELVITQITKDQIVGYLAIPKDTSAVPPRPSSAHVSHNPSDLDEIAKRADDAYAREDYAVAAPLYRRLADSGRDGIINRLGYMYEYGQGLAQDYPQALALFRKASEKGDALAMDNLGWMYEHGRGVAQDYAGAVAWYRKAAENGEARGMRNLGMMYQYGRGAAQDDAQAVAWFRRAAEKGDPAGMNSLGFEYDTGRGVPQDDAQAVAWYRRAAENGDRLGMNNLGWMYQSGRAVAQDDAQAVVWYRKAAGKGEPLGMNNLGWMYENGRGVVKDIAEAIGWYRKAAALGNEKAKASLKRLGQ